MTPERLAVRPQWREHVTAYLSTGARKSELYAIRAVDVDFASNRVRLRGTKTAKSDRRIPMSAQLRAILERRIEARPGLPLFERHDRVGSELTRAAKAAGIDRVTPTDLRRTYASTLLQDGTPPTAVRDLLGHASMRLLDAVYGHIGEDVKQVAVARLHWGSRAEAATGPAVAQKHAGGTLVPLKKRR